MTMLILWVSRYIWHFRNHTVENCPGRCRCAPGGHRIGTTKYLGHLLRQAVCSHKMDELSIIAENPTEWSLAQAWHVPENRLEYRLGVVGRTRNDAQHHCE